MVEDRVELERGVLQLQLAGFDPGEIQDVVDDPEEVSACGADFFDLALLISSQIVALQQVRQSQYRIHGGTDLVAHIGEEVTLSPVGLLGRHGHFPCGIARPDALFLGAHLGGDIATGAAIALEFIFVVENRVAADHDVVDPVIRTLAGEE